MLDVNSRVRSPAVATSTPRSRQPSWPRSSRSPGRFEPTFGRDAGQQRAEHVGQPGQPGVPLLHRVGVVGRELGDLLVPQHGIVGQLQVAAVRVGGEVGTLGVDLVAVALELQLPQDRRRHEADDVGERRDLVVRTPRRLGDGRPADHVAPLQDHHPLAGLGQQAGGDQAVVAATDDDHVVVVRPRHGRPRYRRLVIRRVGKNLALFEGEAPDATRDLERDGYTLLEAVFTPDEVALLAAEVEDVFASVEVDPRPRPDRAEFRYEMLNRSALAQRAVAHPAILAAIEPVLGNDCHVIANTAWRNPPTFGGGPWHCDAGPHVPRPPDVPWDDRIPYPIFAIGAHLYLWDCPLSCGPTAVVPGSHRSGRLAPKDRLFDPDLDYDGRRPVLLEAMAGDVALVRLRRLAPRHAGRTGRSGPVLPAVPLRPARHRPTPADHGPGQPGLARRGVARRHPTGAGPHRPARALLLRRIGPMRSHHADTFNHDEWAAGYDADVADETNPIRAGYQATLEWVVERAAVGPGRRGRRPRDRHGQPGAAAAALPAARRRRRLAQDAGAGRAEARARGRAGDGGRARGVRAPGPLRRRGQHVRHPPPDGGREGRAGRRGGGTDGAGRALRGRRPHGGVPGLGPGRARSSRPPDVDELFADEFPWFVDEILVALDRAGFRGLVAEQLSDLSWGVAARLP